MSAKKSEKKEVQPEDAAAQEAIRLNLARFIAESGLSKIEIARRLGINRSALTDWTSGKKTPNITRIAELCQILGRVPSDFFQPPADAPPSPTEKREIRELVAAFQKLDASERAEILKIVKKRAKKGR